MAFFAKVSVAVALFAMLVASSFADRTMTLRQESDCQLLNRSTTRFVALLSPGLTRASIALEATILTVPNDGEKTDHIKKRYDFLTQVIGQL